MNTDTLEKIILDARRIQRELIRFKAEVPCEDVTRKIHEYLRDAESSTDNMSFWVNRAKESINVNSEHK